MESLQHQVSTHHRDGGGNKGNCIRSRETSGVGCCLIQSIKVVKENNVVLMKTVWTTKKKKQKEKEERQEREGVEEGEEQEEEKVEEQ